MNIEFYKYQATGNDFVLIDNRKGNFPINDTSGIQKLCHRKFGIGADGVILLEASPTADFTMRYYNADGGLGSFCGNGSRAIVSFANFLGIISENARFEAYDGIHNAVLEAGLIQINMADVQNGRDVLNGTFLDTGSPHYIEFVEDLSNLNVVQRGRELRNNPEFEPNGSNINFVERIGTHKISVRTYERGVENETLSCGTGVTAAAIASAGFKGGKVDIQTHGGNLNVWFEKSSNGYQNVWLEGPAEQVFFGKTDI